MFMDLSKPLSDLIATKFQTAKALSHLVFSPTEVAIIRTSTGIPFQLRYCPSLAKKPQPKNESTTPETKTDPFENPSPDLHIIDIPTLNPTHLIVLNKFPIIAEHFIIATKTNKPQTHALERSDLEATYACLKAWEQGSINETKRLFAFYNSGDHSGASQSHRHVQFLPLESMRPSGDSIASWSLLIDLVLLNSFEEVKQPLEQPLQNSGLPFICFTQSFQPEMSGSELLTIYDELYRLAKAAVDDFKADSLDELTLHSSDHGDCSISYNLAMTTSGMAIMPRRTEGTTLRHEDGSDAGFVALNGTTLGGTMMVKHVEQWDLLRKRPDKLDKILEDVGIPRGSSTVKSRV